MAARGGTRQSLGGRDLRLVLTTWNLQGSRVFDVDQVAAHLRQARSDVVALQEVQRRQARALAHRLDAASLYWGFKHWPVWKPAEGMALLTARHTLRDPRSRAVTRRWQPWNWRRRIVQLADVAGHDDSVTLANVHLTSSGRAGAADRQRELQWLLDQPRAPSIIAGDFNARPHERLFAALRPKGFTSAGGGATNWRGEPSHRPPEQQLDYIWVRSDIDVVEVALPGHGQQGFDRFPRISDHLPLTARLEIPVGPSP